MPFSPIKLIALLLAALAFAFTPSGTSAEGWGTSYDELFEEAGASVKRYKTKDGTEVREFISKGGVQIRQERKSGDIQTMTTDLQHGPVFCFWVIAVSVHAVLETCEEAIRPALAKRLDVTIDKLNRFIAANAWEKTTLANMKSAVDGRVQRFRQSQAAPGTGRISCAKRGQRTLAFANQYLADMEKKAVAEYEAGIDNLLSVPRLPAMNPCL